MKLLFTLLTVFLFQNQLLCSDLFLIDGCTDENACNYDENATVDDGSCLFYDGCGDCGGTGVSGCMDAEAINFDAGATCETGACIYALEDNCRDFAFIPNADSASVSVIDIENDVVVTTIPIGLTAIGVDVCAATDRVFVASREDNDVFIIEASTATVIGTHSCGLDPWAVGCTSDGQKLVITGNAFSGPNEECRVMDLNTYVTTSVPVLDSQSGVVISPDDTKAYLALSHDSLVAVLDLVTNTVTEYLQVGINPNGIDISADGNTLYVANYNDQSFTIYDLLNDIRTDVTTGGQYPEGIEVSPDQSQVAIAIQGNNTVEFYDLATLTPTIVDVGTDPNGVSFANNGEMLVVTMQGGDMVYYIDAVNHLVLDSIAVGAHPKALGNFVIPRCVDCANPAACNYDPASSFGDEFCIFPDVCGECGGDGIPGCTNPSVPNYNPEATCDDGSCIGCPETDCIEKAYVGNAGSHNVIVVDVNTMESLDTIDVGMNPIGVAACQSAGRVFVANNVSNNISIIDAVADTLLENIDAVFGPWGIACTTDGQLVVVAGSAGGSNNVSVFDFSGDTLVTPLSVLGMPHSVVISPDNAKAYISIQDLDVISVLDLVTLTWDADLDTEDSPRNLDISPDGNTLFVGNFYDQSLSVIDIGTNQDNPVTVGTQPHGVAVSPDGDYVAIAIQGEDKVCFWEVGQPTPDCVDVGFAPTGISYLSDGITVAVTVTNDNELWTVNSLTLEVDQEQVANSPRSEGKFVMGSCIGCTDPLAYNYNPSATYDDGSCFFAAMGCTYPAANNYDPLAIVDDGSCDFSGISGCTYVEATNYEPLANTDDGSCMFSFPSACPFDTDDNGQIDTLDLLAFLSVFGTLCP